MERSDAPAAPEFSRPVRLSDIGAQREQVALRAGPAEAAALARRFDLDGIAVLEARLSLSRRAPGLVAVSGVFEAEFAIDSPDSDGPTLFTANEAIDEIFATPAGLEALRDLPGGDCEDAEIVADDIVDLGELVAQHLALSLDPALLEIGSLDADATVRSAGAAAPAPADHPFAALSGLRLGGDKAAGG